MTTALPEQRLGATYVLGADASSRQRLDAPWLESPRGPGDPPTPEERPDLTVGLVVAGSSVPFSATYDQAFRLMRGIYIRGGEREVAEFFRANGMMPRRVRDREGSFELEPEEFLPPDRRLAYLLLKAARRRVERIAGDRVRQLEPLAAVEATRRLEEAHAQIEAEVRYLSGPGLAEGKALDDRVPPSVFSLAGGSTVDGLLVELKRCRMLLAELDAAGEQLRNAHGKAVAAAIKALGPFAFVSPSPGAAGQVIVPNRPANEAIARAVEADPTVQAHRATVDAAGAALKEQLLLAGLEYPVLFRIYREADPANKRGVAQAIATTLRRADQANHTLRGDLHGDTDVVWQFPPTVRETLMSFGVPDASIAWIAAEERLEREQGPRLAAQLGMVSGLAAGGVALLGAAVAPPIAVTIALADVIINVIDALQEYLAYRRLRAGFDAVLDPALALGTEPGLLGTVLTIVLDLASAIPVPGARSATQALVP